MDDNDDDIPPPPPLVWGNAEGPHGTKRKLPSFLTKNSDEVNEKSNKQTKYYGGRKNRRTKRRKSMRRRKSMKRRR